MQRAATPEDAEQARTALQQRVRELGANYVAKQQALLSDILPQSQASATQCSSSSNSSNCCCLVLPLPPHTCWQCWW